MISGIRSLRALGEAREAFLDGARAALGVESVVGVQSALDARSYATGPMIELFLDVALQGEKAVVAWMDVVPAEEIDRAIRYRKDFEMRLKSGEISL